MAPSDADLDAAWTKARSKNGPQWVPHFAALRAVAALVRKDDDALILQLVEALECSSPHTDREYRWKPVDWMKRRAEAIQAGRARLEGKP